MRIVVHGINHRTAPLDVRERAALLPDEAAEAMRRLVRDGVAAESVILSTCNRTEFYAVTDEPERVVEAQRGLLRERKEVDAEPGGIAYVHDRRHGAEHLFRVAGGIDSMVIGENGIVAQVKTAFDEARAVGTVGPVFQRLFPAALHMAKRARAETRIGQGAVSLPKAGLTVARRIFGDLAERSALVVGAGATGTQLAHRLREEGVGRITIANRTLLRAEELARDVSGRAVGLEELPAAVAGADLLMTAATVSAPLLDAEQLERIRDRRKVGRPMLVIDLGVPRNVSADCGDLEGVFLYAVDDLQELVELNLGRRRQEVEAVEAIVQEETDRFGEWLVALDATPVLVAMRERAEAVRQETLAKFARHATDGEREHLEQLSRALMNRLLHAPTVSVRQCDASTSLGRTRLDWTRRLFDIDGQEPEGDEAS